MFSINIDNDIIQEIKEVDISHIIPHEKVLLDNKEQILIVKDEFGGTVGLVTMEDIIETLLGVEIVDEDDQDAIEEGNHHEDMRELAKLRLELESAEE